MSRNVHEDEDTVLAGALERVPRPEPTGPSPVIFDGDLHVRLAETIQKHIPGKHAVARDHDPAVHVSNLDELVDALLLAIQVMPVWRELEALQRKAQRTEQAEARAETAEKRIREL